MLTATSSLERLTTSPLSDLDATLPSAHSGAVPWHFFLTAPLFWLLRVRRRRAGGSGSRRVGVGVLNETSSAAGAAAGDGGGGGGGGAPILECAEVMKTYRGSWKLGSWRRLFWPRRPVHVEAVRGLSVSLRGGNVLAVLGQNGAGKSTLLNCVVGLLAPTGGRVEVCGRSIVGDREEYRQEIGFCPQQNLLYEQLSGYECVALFARLRGFGAAGAAAVDAEVRARLGEVSLLPAMHRPSGTYSGGMKRRLSLAIAAVGSPSLLVLDEPSAGMDLISKREMWAMLQQMKCKGSGGSGGGGGGGDGVAIVLVSHDMEEVEALADDVIMMSHGEIARRGTPLELKRREFPQLRARLSVCAEERALRQLEQQLSAEPSHGVSCQREVGGHELSILLSDGDGNGDGDGSGGGGGGGGGAGGKTLEEWLEQVSGLGLDWCVSSTASMEAVFQAVVAEGAVEHDEAPQEPGGGASDGASEDVQADEPSPSVLRSGDSSSGAGPPEKSPAADGGAGTFGNAARAVFAKNVASLRSKPASLACQVLTPLLVIFLLVWVRITAGSSLSSAMDSTGLSAEIVPSLPWVVQGDPALLAEPQQSREWRDGQYPTAARTQPAGMHCLTFGRFVCAAGAHCGSLPKNKDDKRGAMGLLGRIAQSSCLLSNFSCFVPSAGRKNLTWRLPEIFPTPPDTACGTKSIAYSECAQMQAVGLVSVEDSRSCTEEKDGEHGRDDDWLYATLQHPDFELGNWTNPHSSTQRRWGGGGDVYANSIMDLNWRHDNKMDFRNRPRSRTPPSKCCKNMGWHGDPSGTALSACQCAFGTLQAGSCAAVSAYAVLPDATVARTGCKVYTCFGKPSANRPGGARAGYCSVPRDARMDLAHCNQHLCSYGARRDVAQLFSITFVEGAEGGASWEFRGGWDGQKRGAFFDGKLLKFSAKDTWSRGAKNTDGDGFVSYRIGSVGKGVHTLVVAGFENCCDDCSTGWVAIRAPKKLPTKPTTVALNELKLRALGGAAAALAVRATRVSYRSCYHPGVGDDDATQFEYMQAAEFRKAVEECNGAPLSAPPGGSNSSAVQKDGGDGWASGVLGRYYPRWAMGMQWRACLPPAPPDCREQWLSRDGLLPLSDAVVSRLDKGELAGAPELVRRDAAVNFVSTVGPWPDLSPSSFTDFFAVVFDGRLSVEVSGSWRWFLESDDGSVLWIDGSRVIDNDGLHGMAEKSAEMQMTRGRYALRIAFYEARGAAGLRFSMQPPCPSSQERLNIDAGRQPPPSYEDSCPAQRAHDCRAEDAPKGRPCRAQKQIVPTAVLSFSVPQAASFHTNSTAQRNALFLVRRRACAGKRTGAPCAFIQLDNSTYTGGRCEQESLNLLVDAEVALFAMACDVSAADKLLSSRNFPGESSNCAKRRKLSKNVAKGRRASQSSLSRWGAGSSGHGKQLITSILHDSALAVDGEPDGRFGAGSCTHTERSKDAAQWWQVDLGAVHRVDSVVIAHRTDCCAGRLGGARVWLSNRSAHMGTPLAPSAGDAACGGPLSGRKGVWTQSEAFSKETVRCGSENAPQNNSSASNVGRYVRVVAGAPSRYLTLCEVEVFSGCDLEESASESCSERCECFEMRACLAVPSGRCDWYPMHGVCAPRWRNLPPSRAECALLTKEPTRTVKNGTVVQVPYFEQRVSAEAMHAELFAATERLTKARPD